MYLMKIISQLLENMKTLADRHFAGHKPGQYRDLVDSNMKQPQSIGMTSAPEGLQILPNGSLLIETVSQEDEGKYLCEASNGIGVGLSAVVQLTVHGNLLTYLKEFLILCADFHLNFGSFSHLVYFVLHCSTFSN